MWLHARMRKCRLPAVLACCCAALLVPGPVTAAQLPGVDLPQGEKVLDLAWPGGASIVMLVELQDGYALRRLALASGELSVVGVPKGFSMLKPPKAGEPALQLSLARTGDALAVLEPADDPLRPPELSVYRIAGGDMAPVGGSRLPQGFWPALMAWGDGGTLYLVAEPYLFPEQLFSICRFSLRDGAFAGVVLKDNVDLISDLAYLPGRNALAVKCAGLKGQYPAEPLVALVDLAGLGIDVLDGQAGELGLRAQPDGSLLLYGVGGKEADKGGGAQELWILDRGADSLRRVELALGGSAQSLQISPNGEWYGFLQPRGAGQGGKVGELVLGLQSARDGRTMITATPGCAFWFSPDSRFVCGHSESEHRLYFYELRK